MAKREQPEVLVAGAGPVGQFMALDLASRGIAVEIVEEGSQSAGHSYALALHGESLRLFDELGLLGEVQEEALRVPTVAFYEGNRRRAEIRLETAGYPPYLAVVGQSGLERLLGDALKKRGVKIRWNHRLARFDEVDGGVRVVVDKLVKDSVGYAVSGTGWLVGKSRESTVAFVVGADGHQSLVRRQLGIPFPEVGAAQHFSVFEFTTDADPGQEMRVILDAAGTTLFWPLPGQRCRFSFESLVPIASERSRRKDRLVFQFRGLAFPALEQQHLLALLEERAPWFDGGVGEVYWNTVVRFDRRLADSFGAGRLLLIGDAGHMTGPVGVQSMNVGFREAHELSGILHRILRKGGSVTELEQYREGRLAEWRRLLGIDARLVARKGADNWVREHAGQLLPCLPASGAWLAALADGLGLELRA